MALQAQLAFTRITGRSSASMTPSLHHGSYLGSRHARRSTGTPPYAFSMSLLPFVQSRVELHAGECGIAAPLPRGCSSRLRALHELRDRRAARLRDHRRRACRAVGAIGAHRSHFTTVDFVRLRFFKGASAGYHHPERKPPQPLVPDVRLPGLAAVFRLLISTAPYWQAVSMQLVTGR